MNQHGHGEVNLTETIAKCTLYLAVRDGFGGRCLFSLNLLPGLNSTWLIFDRERERERQRRIWWPDKPLAIFNKSEELDYNH